MEILKEYDDKNLTLSVKGRVDTLTSKDMEKEINDEIGNFDSLAIDFSELEYISSAGLRVLISTQKKLNPNNIPMVIKNSNPNIKELFRMSSFDKLLTIE